MNSTLFDDAPRPTLHVAPPGAIVLRDYQEECLARVEAAIDRGQMAALIVLATGAGKTTIFAELIRRMRRSRPPFPVLVLAHQIELLDQAAKRIRLMAPGARVSILSGAQKHDPFADVIVAGVQSLARGAVKKLGRWRPKLIIVDEAHHACADGYQNVFNELGVYEDGGPDLLGVTATPHRMDNKPLHGDDRAIFDEILYSYTLRQSIADGYLCNIRGFRVSAEGLELRSMKKTAGDFNQGALQDAMNREAITRVAFDNWRKVAGDRRTLVFCAGVEHAAEVANFWNKLGVPAATVNGKMLPEERERNMRRFRTGEVQVLTNMQLVTEGVDVPEIDCVLMLRPTQSWSLYQQMVGRCLRPSPGCLEGLETPGDRIRAIGESPKRDAIVIDIVGNSDAHELGKAPPVGLASIFDLPPGVDLAGDLITEAIEAVENLGEEERAKLFKRVLPLVKFSELQEVDMLGELNEVDELTARASFAWLKLGEDLYHVDCGSSSVEERRRATMRCDALGTWMLRLKSDRREEDFQLRAVREESFREAEVLIARHFDGAGAVASKRALWRTQGVSEKQVKWLRKAGCTSEQIAKMTKGQASQVLNKYFAAKGGSR